MESPAITQAINSLWLLLPKSSHGQCLPLSSYLTCMVAMQKILSPYDFDMATITSKVEDDFKRLVSSANQQHNRSFSNGQMMNFELFKESLQELLIVWVDTERGSKDQTHDWMLAEILKRMTGGQQNKLLDINDMQSFKKRDETEVKQTRMVKVTQELQKRHDEMSNVESRVFGLDEFMGEYADGDEMKATLTMPKQDSSLELSETIGWYLTEEEERKLEDVGLKSNMCNLYIKEKLVDKPFGLLDIAPSPWEKREAEEARRASMHKHDIPYDSDEDSDVEIEREKRRNDLEDEESKFKHVEFVPVPLRFEIDDNNDVKNDHDWKVDVETHTGVRFDDRNNYLNTKNINSIFSPHSLLPNTKVELSVSGYSKSKKYEYIVEGRDGELVVEHYKKVSIQQPIQGKSKKKNQKEDISQDSSQGCLSYKTTAQDLLKFDRMAPFMNISQERALSFLFLGPPGYENTHEISQSLCKTLNLIHITPEYLLNLAQKEIDNNPTNDNSGKFQVAMTTLQNGGEFDSTIICQLLHIALLQDDVIFHGYVMDQLFTHVHKYDILNDCPNWPPQFIIHVNVSLDDVLLAAKKKRNDILLSPPHSKEIIIDLTNDDVNTSSQAKLPTQIDTHVSFQLNDDVQADMIEYVEMIYPAIQRMVNNISSDQCQVITIDGTASSSSSLQNILFVLSQKRIYPRPIVLDSEEILNFLSETKPKRDEDQYELFISLPLVSTQEDSNGERIHETRIRDDNVDEDDTEERMFKSNYTYGVWQQYCPVTRKIDDELKFGEESLACAYRGQVYHFCSKKYLDLFILNPFIYISSPPSIPDKYIICFIGGLGVGKSTLALKLKERTSGNWDVMTPSNIDTYNHDDDDNKKNQRIILDGLVKTPKDIDTLKEKGFNIDMYIYLYVDSVEVLAPRHKKGGSKINESGLEDMMDDCYDFQETTWNTILSHIPQHILLKEVCIDGDILHCVSKIQCAIDPFLSYRLSNFPRIISEDEREDTLDNPIRYQLQIPQLSFIPNNNKQNNNVSNHDLPRQAISFCPVCLRDHQLLFSGSVPNNNVGFLDIMNNIDDDDNNNNKKKKKSSRTTEKKSTSHVLLRSQNMLYSLCSTQHAIAFQKAFARYSLCFRPEQYIQPYLPALRILLLGNAKSGKTKIAKLIQEENNLVANGCHYFSLFDIMIEPMKEFISNLLQECEQNRMEIRKKYLAEKKREDERKEEERAKRQKKQQQQQQHNDEEYSETEEDDEEWLESSQYDDEELIAIDKKTIDELGILRDFISYKREYSYPGQYELLLSNVLESHLFVNIDGDISDDDDDTDSIELNRKEQANKREHNINSLYELFVNLLNHHSFGLKFTAKPMSFILECDVYEPTVVPLLCRVLSTLPSAAPHVVLRVQSDNESQYNRLSDDFNTFIKKEDAIYQSNIHPASIAINDNNIHEQSMDEEDDEDMEELHYHPAYLVPNEPINTFISQLDDVEDMIQSNISLSNECTESYDNILSQQGICVLPDILNTDENNNDIIIKKINDILGNFIEIKDNLFVNVEPIYPQDANLLLKSGQKTLHQFGTFCPICISNNNEPCMIRNYDCLEDNDTEMNSFPLVWHDRVIYCCTQEHQNIFRKNVSYYLSIKTPNTWIPPSISIIGAPSSGKTTLANKLSNEFGCIYLSPNNIIEKMITDNKYKNTSLGITIQELLLESNNINDNIFIEAVKFIILSSDCRRYGYILDGIPSNLNQCHMMVAKGIQIVNILSLQFHNFNIAIKEISKREKNNNNINIQLSNMKILMKNSMKPMNNNHDDDNNNIDDDNNNIDDNNKIYKNALKKAFTTSYTNKNEIIEYQINEISMCSFLQETYDNVHVIDAQLSRWGITSHALDFIMKKEKSYEAYIESNRLNNPAKIGQLSLNTNLLKEEFTWSYKSFCPVCWIDHDELNTDTSDRENWLLYDNHMYKCCNQDHCNQFIDLPNIYTMKEYNDNDKKLAEEQKKELEGEGWNIQYDEQTSKPLPNIIPKRLSFQDCQRIEAENCNLMGNCPIELHDGMKRGYFKIVQGIRSCTVTYDNNIYRFSSENALNKFMKRPEPYYQLKLPTTRPVSVHGVNEDKLNKMGLLMASLEKSFSGLLTRTLVRMDKLRPVYPTLSPSRSAMLFVALNLKSSNEALSKYSQEQFKKKLELVLDDCELVSSLAQLYRDDEQQQQQQHIMKKKELCKRYDTIRKQISEQNVQYYSKFFH